MGSLANGSSTVYLPASTLIGRGPHADWVIPSRSVSTEHARIAWRQSAWVLKDLGSRNGTFVDGKRLEAGETALLQTGMSVGFGAPEPSWQVVETEGPRPMATHPDGQLIVGSSELLLLPPDEPEVAVLRGEAGWYVERGAREEALESVVEVAGVAWRIEVPLDIVDTLETQGRHLHDLVLEFSVSRDEEHIELTGRFPSGDVALGSRSHHHLLLFLARQRLGDNDADEGERGWVYGDEAARALGITESMLNLHVHRARRQLAEAEVMGGPQLVQRRGQTGQLRLGVTRAVIS